jgi:hypothetical protein
MTQCIHLITGNLKKAERKTYPDLLSDRSDFDHFQGEIIFHTRFSQKNNKLVHTLDNMI